MAAQNLGVVLCQVNDGIAFCKRESAIAGLNSIPLSQSDSYRASSRLPVLPTFCEFPGVICPNSEMFESTATYVVSVSSGLSVAVPKYLRPCR